MAPRFDRFATARNRDGVLRVANLMKIAESRVSARDRSGLGSFAVDDRPAVFGEAYILMDFFEDLSVTGRAELFPRFHSSDDELYENLDVAYSEESGTSDLSDIDPWASETLFWWLRLDGRYRRYARKVTNGTGGVDQVAKDWIKRLSVIHDNPLLHEYFAAGIWDVDFAERCRSEGVDSSLAASVSSAMKALLTKAT